MACRRASPPARRRGRRTGRRRRRAACQRWSPCCATPAAPAPPRCTAAPALRWPAAGSPLALQRSMHMSGEWLVHRVACLALRCLLDAERVCAMTCRLQARSHQLYERNIFSIKTPSNSIEHAAPTQMRPCQLSPKMCKQAMNQVSSQRQGISAHQWRQRGQLLQERRHRACRPAWQSPRQ